MSAQSAHRDWVVLKFGGTSVSTRETWDTIRAEAARRVEEGLRPLIVCSALSGVSDALERLLADAEAGRHGEGLAALRARHTKLGQALGVDAGKLLEADLRQIGDLLMGVSLIHEVSPRLKALVMSFGELMSTRLGAAFLQSSGLSAGFLDVRDHLDSVEDLSENPRRGYLSATCTFAPDRGLKTALGARPESVLVTQGFIARGPNRDTVLLGRGGSDTSASYLAARLEAVRCEIWTDVPGIFSANPRQIPQARLLRSLDYEEAQEIVSTGAKVLHPRCILPLKTARIPIHLRDTFHPDAAGTVITGSVPSQEAQVKAVSTKRGVTLISMDTVGMWQQVGFLADVFGCFKKHGFSVDLVSTSETNVTVTLDPTANPTDRAVLAPLLKDLGAYCKTHAVAPCAVVSLVGRNIRAILHQLGPALQVFNEKRMYLVSQAASDLNLTVVVDEDEVDRLATEVHRLCVGQRIADPNLGPSWQQLVRGSEEEPVEAVAGSWWAGRREELLGLARERATPMFVYDAATLAESVADLRSLSAVTQVFYAVKANYNEGILRLFHDAGLGFECVSPGELELLVSLFPGMSPERLLFTPNFAPRGEYARALEMGVRVTLDNLHPLRAWPELFAGREILVRLDPGTGRGHHRHVHTAGEHSKFGVPPDDLDELRTLVREAGARVVGLHAHTGSGILTPENWKENARFLAGVAQSFPDVRALDLGGGLGIPERPGQERLDLGEVARSLAQVAAACPQYELWLEPGRFLVGRAGVILTRVTQVKRKGPHVYLGVDVGMNTLIRPALYGAYHHIVNLTRAGMPLSERATIVGPICESGDVLGDGRAMPRTEEGDVLLIGTAGAYGRSMSSSYNLREPAAEVFLA